MESFTEHFKKAFFTGLGYACSLVFTSKMSQLFGLFTIKNDTNEFSKCNCDCNKEEDSDLIHKDDVTEDPDKFKNLLNKLK